MGKDDFRYDPALDLPVPRGPRQLGTPHLKEISGRLQKLSFREMGQLAALVLERLMRDELIRKDIPISNIDIGEVLFDVADQIGGEP